MEKQLLILGTKLGKTFTAETFGTELVALIGEKDAAILDLTGKMTALQSDAADGKAFRKVLVDDMIKAGVLLEEIKTDETSQKAEETYLMTVPIERLKTMSGKAMDAAKAKFPDKFQIPASDQSDREKSDLEAEQSVAAGKSAGAGKPSLTDMAKEVAAASKK